MTYPVSRAMRKALAETDSNAIITAPITSEGTSEKENSNPKATKPSTKKRPAAAVTEQDEPPLSALLSSEDDDDDDDSSEDGATYFITENCDQIRRKITTFIDSGEMKASEFQRAIGVSAHSYQTFLRQHGREKGMRSSTYINAACFFQKRELQGLPPPKKKRVSKKKTDENKNKYDVSSVHLEGEADLDVPVYDTCDVVRKKIQQHLRHPDVTQAAFLRDAAKAAYPEDSGKKLNAKSLNDFLCKSGPTAGNASSIFYASYVFFEKLRIRDGKPKTKFRLEMEDRWGWQGFDLECSSKKRYIIPAWREVYVDRYGQISVV